MLRSLLFLSLDRICNTCKGGNVSLHLAREEGLGGREGQGGYTLTCAHSLPLPEPEVHMHLYPHLQITYTYTHTHNPPPARSTLTHHTPRPVEMHMKLTGEAHSHIQTFPDFPPHTHSRPYTYRHTLKHLNIDVGIQTHLSCA